MFEACFGLTNIDVAASKSKLDLWQWQWHCWNSQDYRRADRFNGYQHIYENHAKFLSRLDPAFEKLESGMLNNVWVAFESCMLHLASRHHTYKYPFNWLYQVFEWYFAEKTKGKQKLWMIAFFKSFVTGNERLCPLPVKNLIFSELHFSPAKYWMRL